MAVCGFGLGLAAASATRTAAIIANLRQIVDISVYTDEDKTLVDDDVDTFEEPLCSQQPRTWCGVCSVRWAVTRPAKMHQQRATDMPSTNLSTMKTTVTPTHGANEALR
jgi:hypothetical protein